MTRADLAAGLGLAATPTFATMAMLSALDTDPVRMICTAAGASPLTGMPAMYLLMSVFHLPAWFKMVGDGVRRTA